MISDRPVAWFNMLAVSSISTINVLRPVEMSSCAPTKPGRIMYILNNRPGNRQCIGGRRAPPDLVQYDKRPPRSVVQYVGRLLHLHHKRAAPRRDVVLCPYQAWANYVYTQQPPWQSPVHRRQTCPSRSRPI